MKQMALAVALTVLISVSAQAHTRLAKSTPGDGSVVATAPANLALEFAHPVRITALTIQKADGKSEALGPLPQEAAAKFSVPAPKLGAGMYVVNWRAVSSDNHVMSGKFRFTVSAANTGDHAANP